jgi:hypothetical protein
MLCRDLAGINCTVSGVALIHAQRGAILTQTLPMCAPLRCWLLSTQVVPGGSPACEPRADALLPATPPAELSSRRLPGQAAQAQPRGGGPCRVQDVRAELLAGLLPAAHWQCQCAFCGVALIVGREASTADAVWCGLQVQ